MASETAQHHVTEIVERDASQMEALLQMDTLKGVNDIAKFGFYEHLFLRLMGTISNSWNIFDFDVFIVSICSDIFT